MQQGDDEITIWIDRLAEQPEAAAEKIWAHYYQKLVTYAARKLGPAARRSRDEEDIALSAIHSLHEGARAGRFPDLRNRDDLWKLLLTIASRKAMKSIRYEMAQKRGGGKVRGESLFANVNSQHGGLAEFVEAEPSPEFAEIVSTESTELLEQLKDETLKKIAVLKLQGYSNAEIATQLGCAVRSVERKLKRIRTEWQQYA